MSRLPLRYRLPNPPAVFVGREREMAWLVEAIRRAPVAVVQGPGGLGKTALVLQTLHRRFKRQIKSVLFVSLPSLSVDELLPEILRALVAAEGVQDVDWHALQGDPEAMLESLLDLAESSRWWVVLDDVHHGEPAEVRRLLGQLSRYARNSKWIATSRMDPQLEDATQVVALEGMPADELEGLAREWAKTAAAEELSRAVRVACGSPWLLQQSLATGRAEPVTSRDALLENLPADATTFLEALAAVRIRLPLETLRRWAPVPEPPQLEALERRGLVEITPAGIRLHDVVRGVLAAPGSTPTSGDWAERAADALVASDDREEVLEALRLMLETGRVEDAASLLDRDGDTLLEGGYAPRLWHLIEHATDDRLSRWRLRCVAELGNPTALKRVGEPEETGGAEGLTWARTLYMRGDLAAAGRLAGELHARARADGQAELAISAGLLAARCLELSGERERAVTLLRSLETDDPDTAALRDAELAQCLARDDDVQNALSLAEQLHAALGDLSGRVREEVTWAVAHTLCLTGRLDEADELARRLQGTPRGGAPTLSLARRAIWLRAEVSLQRGDLSGAEERLDTLDPFIRGASLWRPAILCTRAALRLARGEMEGLRALLQGALREATSFGDEVARAHALASICELDTLEARRTDAQPNEAGLLVLRRAEQLVRNGEAPTNEMLQAVGRIGAPDLLPLTHGLRARMALVDGDGEGATVHAQEAVRRARRTGHAVREAEMRDLECEIACVLGRTAALAGGAEELGRLAERIGSRRFAHASDLWTRAAEQHPRWASIERLTLVAAEAPVVARRAQALLGGSPETDVSDTLLMESLRARPGFRPPSVVGASQNGHGWTPGWGLDEQRHVAWLADGSDVDFSKRNLHWRLLEALADAGGHATKEQLVREVWGEDEYHPLKHDPRLHVAIRKLRELLEEDPSQPERIVTAEDGYSLGGPLRRVAADRQ